MYLWSDMMNCELCGTVVSNHKTLSRRRRKRRNQGGRGFVWEIQHAWCSNTWRVYHCLISASSPLRLRRLSPLSPVGCSQYSVFICSVASEEFTENLLVIAVMSSSSYVSTIFEWSLFAGKCTFGVLSLIAVLLYTHQDKLLYIPNPPGFPQKPTDNPAPFRSPSDWTVQGKKSVSDTNSIPFEEEHLATPDGKLIHTWLMLQTNSINVPTLIYFHGNAGANILQKCLIWYQIVDRGRPTVITFPSREKLLF